MPVGGLQLTDYTYSKSQAQVGRGKFEITRGSGEILLICRGNFVFIVREKGGNCECAVGEIAHSPRLPLVGEITYNRGNEVFVGGRGNLRGKGNKIGGMLENVRGLIRNCVIDNQMKIKDFNFMRKVTEQVPNWSKKLQIQIQFTQN